MGASSEKCLVSAVGLLGKILLEILQNRPRNIQRFRIATATLAIVFSLNFGRVAAKVGLNLDEL